MCGDGYGVWGCGSKTRERTTARSFTAWACKAFTVAESDLGQDPFREQVIFCGMSRWVAGFWTTYEG